MDGKLILYIVIGLAYYAYQIYKQVQKKNETKPPVSEPQSTTNNQSEKQGTPFFQTQTTSSISETGLLGYKYHPEAPPQIEDVSTTAYRSIQIEQNKNFKEQTISIPSKKNKAWFSGENSIKKAFINSIIIEKKY